MLRLYIKLIFQYLSPIDNKTRKRQGLPVMYHKIAIINLETHGAL